MIQGPAVMVSMTLGGSLSVSQVSSAVQKQLESAVANALGVQPVLVQFVSLKDARRRLLALSVTLRVRAANAADAAMLQAKTDSADFTNAIKMQTGLDVPVSGVNAKVLSDPDAVDVVAAPETSNHPNTIIAAVVGSVGGLLLIITATYAVTFYVRRRKLSLKTARGSSQNSRHSLPTFDNPLLRDTSAGGDDVLVNVQDAGAGIAMAEQVRVQPPFKMISRCRCFVDHSIVLVSLCACIPACVYANKKASMEDH